MTERTRDETAPRRPLLALVDDDPQVRKLVERYLGNEGFIVNAYPSAEAFWPAFEARPPDLVLLDVRLPGEDGFSVAHRLRQQSRVGIVMLTGKSDTTDTVVGLEVGADDYIAKPFELRELLARVRSLLRRLSERPEPRRGAQARSVVRFAGWELDRTGRTLSAPGGERVKLTGKEFELLSLLAERCNVPLSREFILERLDGRGHHPFDRSVDVLIFQLRSKMSAAGGAALLTSVRGVGYMLCAEVEAG